MGNHIYVTAPLRQKIMMESHALPYAGYHGKEGTHSVLERHFYWPSLHKDIYDFVEEHLTYQKVKFD